MDAVFKVGQRVVATGSYMYSLTEGDCAVAQYRLRFKTKEQYEAAHKAD